MGREMHNVEILLCWGYTGAGMDHCSYVQASERLVSF
jgi:hypothetical protein